MIRIETGLTVKRLKELLENWPEKNSMGEDSEIWIETGEMRTSLVVEFSQLNDTDICLASDTFNPDSDAIARS